MLGLSACKGSLTPDIRLGIHKRNDDLMVKPGGMPSQLHVLANKYEKDDIVTITLIKTGLLGKLPFLSIFFFFQLLILISP
jgi:hypothetical protein